MWNDPEAQSKLIEIIDLTTRARQRCNIVRARGTAADRAMVIGFSMELLIGVAETFEVDGAFRSHARQLNEQWLTVHHTLPELNHFFGTVTIALDRLLLICRSLSQETATQADSL